MRTLKLICTAIAIVQGFAVVSQSSNNIIIDAEIPESYRDDSVGLYAFPLSLYNLEEARLLAENCYYKFNIVKGRLKCTLPIREPVYIRSAALNKDRSMFIAEPGDSLVTEIIDGKLYFHGRGWEKYKLLYESQLLKNELQEPVRLADRKDEVSEKDLIGWYSYTDSLINFQLALLENYKATISRQSFVYFQSTFITQAEKDFMDNFNFLLSQQKKIGLSPNAWEKIYDATLGDSYFFKLQLHTSDTACTIRGIDDYLSAYSFFKQLRNNRFQDLYTEKQYSSEDLIQITVDSYHNIKQTLTGLARITTLKRLLRYAVRDLGFNLEINKCVEDFLLIPGYPGYTGWMKTYVAQRKNLSGGALAPEFALESNEGTVLSLSELKGKFVLLDFWFTGCKGCLNSMASLKRIEAAFSGNKAIEFVSISIDQKRDKWLKSITERKYTLGNGRQLFTSGRAENHPVISAYRVSSYPTFFVIAPNGMILSAPDPRIENGAALIRVLQNEIAKQADGPYVHYTASHFTSKSVEVVNGVQAVAIERFPIEQKEKVLLHVHTESLEETFSVRLKKTLVVEPCVFEKPEKMFVLSDIEGNFAAFRKLLTSSSVIDKNFKWTFGKGHLVLVGDFFDRGKQVTEVLWLIYSLEQQAKAKGGYVHYILGNHELMNLNGKHNYVHGKYTVEVANLLGEEYRNFYSRDAELGRWLRTKNVIEKIGDIIFVHGGISAAINRSQLTISDINNLLRPYYDQEQLARSSQDLRLSILFQSRTSPFWYRGYFEKEYSGYNPNDSIKTLAPMSQVDSTLRNFGVHRIITGHTIVADSISVHYDGKVLNTDTKHADGKSEALMIENDKYYRATATGQKEALLIPERPNLTKASVYP